jgi:hypothetical protein
MVVIGPGERYANHLVAAGQLEAHRSFAIEAGAGQPHAGPGGAGGLEHQGQRVRGDCEFGRDGVALGELFRRHLDPRRASVRTEADCPATAPVLPTARRLVALRYRSIASVHALAPALGFEWKQPAKHAGGARAVGEAIARRRRHQIGFERADLDSLPIDLVAGDEALGQSGAGAG